MRDNAAWGVEPGYWDALGQWRNAPSTTVEAVLDALGATEGERPPGLGADNPVWVVRSGERVRVAGRWRLLTEDGGDDIVEGRLPREVPLGYHRLRDLASDRTVKLVVAPERCHLPPGLREWGWAAQLYATRSHSSWGMGDLGDLADLGRWSRSQGAGFVLVNPLHAASPGRPQQASPYFSGSRAYRNLLYVDVEQVDGHDPDDPDLRKAVRAGRGLNRERRIDRDAVYDVKVGALERIWELRGDRLDVGLAEYCAAEGRALEEHATFCALAEVHGPRWWGWPAAVRSPDGSGISEFQREFASRIAFHRWVQWLADQQLGRASEATGIVQDLAVGVDPAGSDGWRWQDALALTMNVGAPPDEFNTQGQDWGLPPFDPWKLRLAGFEPFIEAVRAGLRHSAGLRIDHVMGLFRLFWIPKGEGAQAGTYVRYPFEELLDILALESIRAGAFVVGEDLGTVEDEARDQLARRDVLSYRLLWFEPDGPSTWPAKSLAAVTTHDLPTISGLLSGRDIEVQRSVGMVPNEKGTQKLVANVAGWSGVDAGRRPGPEAVERVHRVLAQAPSMLLAATLEDALGVDERPNYPGTTDERPNWSMALPVAVEDLDGHPGTAAVADALGSRPDPPPPS